jgi:glycosyltransferase involved in cell wall biosynthesis
MPTTLSVLIDTYNHEKYIAAAINSVLEQRHLSDVLLDIVVLDDGSTDNTGEIVQSFGDKIRYYRKDNGGQASAFNYGIPLCRGEIIFFLDGDDWWHPDKICVVLTAFLNNSNLCAVGHSFVEVDQVGGDRFTNGPTAAIYLTFSSARSVSLFHKYACCLGTSRLAIRRSAAFSLLEVPTDLVFEADEYMFTLLPTLGEVMILPDILTYYRIHGENLFQDSRIAILKYSSNRRTVKRATVYRCLSEKLPGELRKRGCDVSLLELLMRPVHVQAARLKLITEGGTRLENFKSEWRAAELFERSTAKSRIVLGMSLLLTLICSPRLYFRMRAAYANWLRRSQQLPD